MSNNVGRGGKRQGAGRPVGATTTRTRDIANAVAAGGVTPLEYLIDVMLDETQELSVRLDAAKAAAPFMHPRLNATTLRGDPVNPIMLAVASAEELRSKIRGQTARPSAAPDYEEKIAVANVIVPSPSPKVDRLEGYRDQGEQSFGSEF